jgi:hypothetical protein
MANNIVKPFIRWISQLLKSAWLFFPGILFILFPVFCFWIMGQGKDIMTAFINNESGNSGGLYFNGIRLLFFTSIAFWVYVSWYSSRIIAYIKKNRQQLDMEAITVAGQTDSEDEYKKRNSFFEIGKGFLDAFPRLIGNSCFLVLELAFFQLPVFSPRIGMTTAMVIFVVALAGLFYLNKKIEISLNKWIEKKYSGKTAFTKTFWTLLYSFIGLLIISCFFHNISILVFLFLLLFLHVVFIYYINLRRPLMETGATNIKISEGNDRTLQEKMMDYFCIPRKESGYYRWFLIICIAGILLYLTSIFQLGFARRLGPFPFLILAFGVLLAFGNVVTAFSVRYKVNFHFLLFVLGLLLGLKETHSVRTDALQSSDNRYREKPDLKKYLTAWLNEKMDSTRSRYDMYFIMANGGASRSGYWTAAVLGSIEDSSIVRQLPQRFSDHIFCLSGTSGGGVGVATFFGMLKDKATHRNPVYAATAKDFLKRDYFTYTVARMLGPDFFNYIFHAPFMEDRAGALEMSFEQSSRNSPDSGFRVPFDNPFSDFPAMIGNRVSMPLLFINTTRMQDGTPAVVSNLRVDGKTFNGRIDVTSLVDSNKDMTITTASILGARFPYLSPAGRIKDNYFVDGGYFDNSGAGTVQELIRGIINIGKTDPVLNDKIQRLNFRVIHIVNSPTGFESKVESVAPIKNDLMSPILTIVGAYSMQTTVNDSRLVNFINDINAAGVNMASYTQISLYLKPNEIKVDKDHPYHSEAPYAMNWFMSDTTRRRIDNRLAANPELSAFTGSLK